MYDTEICNIMYIHAFVNRKIVWHTQLKRLSYLVGHKVSVMPKADARYEFYDIFLIVKDHSLKK